MKECVPKASPIVILCVDDDPSGLLSRRMLLERLGFEVLGAASGGAALRMLHRRRVDLVITDHFLPGMTGVELIAAVKLLRPQLPVMMLTGAMEAPPGSEQADLVLIKGADPQRFLAEVAKLLAKRLPPADTNDDSANLQ